MTEQVLSTYKTKVKSLEIAPFSDGRFEVSINGNKIFSKHATGRFPEWDELAPELDRFAGA